jgi:hypothetical protein
MSHIGCKYLGDHGVIFVLFLPLAVPNVSAAAVPNVSVVAVLFRKRTYLQRSTDTN